MTPAWANPRPAGLSGMAVSSEPIRATNTAPDRPSWTSGKPSACTTMPEPQALGHPDHPGEEREQWQVAQADGPEDAFLEPVVEVQDPRRERQAGQDPAAEVAHREQADAEHDHDDEARR